MNIEQIYIEFNDFFQSIYREHVEYLNPELESKYAEEHLIQLSTVLAPMIDEKLSDRMIEAWKINTLNKLKKIKKPNRGWDLEDLLRDNIKTIITESQNFLGIYKKHYLPLQEKILLQNSMPSSTEDNKKSKTNKI